MKLAFVLVLAIALAGCFKGDSTPAAPPIDYHGLSNTINNTAFPVLMQDHANGTHFDAVQHRASMNIQRIGYSNGVDNSGNPNRILPGVTYTELAVHGNYAYLARVSQQVSAAGVDPTSIPVVKGGFVVINIANPFAPKFVGEYNGPNGFDLDLSDDGQLAFFAAQRNTIEEVVLNAGETQDPTDAPIRGIHVVSLVDKTNPKLVGFAPIPPNGPHTTTYHRNSAGEYLIAATYDFLGSTVPVGTVPPVLPLPAEEVRATQRILVYQIERLATGDVELVQVNHFQITDNPPNGRLFFPHDTRVQTHPDGSTYLYVAYWDKGVQIIPFNDPTAVPLTVHAQWNDFSPSSRNNIHLVQPFDEPLQGRHITVAEPEIISADETGQFTFLDTTDMSDISLAGIWTLPGDLLVQSFNFSPHNFDTFGGMMALAHNHGGLWVLDVGNNLNEPKATGFTLEVEERNNSPAMQPQFWGVFEVNGYLYASDVGSGLYIYEYTGPR